MASAEYLETITKLGKLDVVIISSNWCGYYDDIKLRCRDERVGIFDIKDFIAALNRPDFWAYLNDWEKERFKKRGIL